MLLTTNASKDEETYVDAGLRNLPADQKDAVKILHTREEVVQMTNHAGGAATGKRGYFNPKAGWADADQAMRWVADRARQTGRVRFEQGEVKEVKSGEVLLVDGKVLKADVIVVAVGSWVEELMKREVAGRVKRCPQPLGYVRLNDEQWAKVKDWPVHFNVSDGK